MDNRIFMTYEERPKLKVPPQSVTKMRGWVKFLVGNPINLHYTNKKDIKEGFEMKPKEIFQECEVVRKAFFSRNKVDSRIEFDETKENARTMIHLKLRFYLSNRQRREFRLLFFHKNFQRDYGNE